MIYTHKKYPQCTVDALAFSVYLLLDRSVTTGDLQMLGEAVKPAAAATHRSTLHGQEAYGDRL
jgi:hypothetical protein